MKEKKIFGKNDKTTSIFESDNIFSDKEIKAYKTQKTTFHATSDMESLKIDRKNIRDLVNQLENNKNFDKSSIKKISESSNKEEPKQEPISSDSSQNNKNKVSNRFSHPEPSKITEEELKTLEENYENSKLDLEVAKMDLDLEVSMKQMHSELSDTPLISEELQKSFETYQNAKKNFDNASNKFLEGMEISKPSNAKGIAQISSDKKQVELEAENYEKQIPKNDHPSIGPLA